MLNGLNLTATRPTDGPRPQGPGDVSLQAFRPRAHPLDLGGRAGIPRGVAIRSSTRLHRRKNGRYSVWRPLTTRLVNLPESEWAQLNRELDEEVA